MKSVQEIKRQLEEAPIEALPALLAQYETDERKGVRALAARFAKKEAQRKEEMQRLEKLLEFERACYEKGYSLVAGIDEVGRGPLAGPVMAAAVILPKECRILGINDSKQLSAKKREELEKIIRQEAVAVGFGSVDAARIDEINILQATYEAMRQALAALCPQADFVLADAVTIPEIKLPQTGIVKGDARSISIGAASILAKVKRDHFMEEMDLRYPGYGFASNKGYGSSEHMRAIETIGMCPLHRRSFLKNMLSALNGNDMGIVAEQAAEKEMRRLGYEILERNYHTKEGEIDIIAKKDGVLVFTEVKYRKSDAFGTPAEAVGYAKQEKIKKAALQYLAEREMADTDCRFDVAECKQKDGKLYFRYTENAFWF